MSYFLHDLSLEGEGEPSIDGQLPGGGGGGEVYPWLLAMMAEWDLQGQR